MYGNAPGGGGGGNGGGGGGGDGKCSVATVIDVPLWMPQPQPSIFFHLAFPSFFSHLRLFFLPPSSSYRPFHYLPTCFSVLFLFFSSQTYSSLWFILYHCKIIDDDDDDDDVVVDV